MSRKKHKQSEITKICRILRLALTGNLDGLPIGIIVELLGKEETFKRIQNTIDIFKEIE